MKNFIDELKWRGMLQDIIPGTEDHLNNNKSLGYIPKNIAQKLAPELRDNKCSYRAKICKINTDLYGDIFGLSIIIKHDAEIILFKFRAK